MVPAALVNHLLDAPAPIARNGLIQKVASAKAPMVGRLLSLIPEDYPGTIREWINTDGLGVIIEHLAEGFVNGENHGDHSEVVQQCPHCNQFFL